MVVFDLDGTLVDSQLDFTELRRRLGWPEHTLILEHLATLSCAVERQQAAQIIVDFELEGARKALSEPGAAPTARAPLTREVLDSAAPMRVAKGIPVEALVALRQRLAAALG